MPSAEQRAARRTRRNLEGFAALPFNHIKHLSHLSPHDAALKTADQNYSEAYSNLQMRMENARFHNVLMRNRCLDQFTAREMQDPQMMERAEWGVVTQRIVLDGALGKVYRAIKQLKNAKEVVRKLRW